MAKKRKERMTNPETTRRSSGSVGLVVCGGLGVVMSLVWSYHNLKFESSGSERSSIVTIPPGQLVSGYVPEYRLDHVRDNIDVFARSANELILFSVHPGVDGSVKHDPGLAKERLDFAQKAKAAGVKRILLSVGGGGRSGFFSSATRTEGRRAKLVESLLALCRQYSLDGIDIDWEIPQSADEKEALMKLLRELRDYLKPQGLYLTVALHYWEKVPLDMHELVDRVNFMTYDFAGPSGFHSFPDTQKAIGVLLSSGVPPSKIAMGVPLYARSISGVKTYSELVSGWSDFTPSINKYNGFVFNGRNQCIKKARWAAQQGLAGVFVWEIGQDTLDPATALLPALSSGLSTRKNE